MNVHTRAELQALLDDLAFCSVVAVDTETDGLNLWQGHKPISMSFYFPEFESSYNFAWGHGTGQIEIPVENQDTSKFHSWTWQGKGKKQVYKAYWFEKYRALQTGNQNITLNGEVNNSFGNCPVEWLDLIRTAWNDCIVGDEQSFFCANVIYYNAPFDIHMMKSIGFRQPKFSEDVRIAVSLVFEDWNHPSIGGNNRLKWQAEHWGIEGALDGEADLHHEIDVLTSQVAGLVCLNWDDPINSSFHKLKRPAHLNEIADKLSFDDKGELWCLPSDAAAPYAENDTRITWLLREKLLVKLGEWNQVALYHDWCNMQSEFLIRIEENGILLDVDRANELVEEMGPIISEVNQWINGQVVEAWQAGEIPEDVYPLLLNAKGQLKLTGGSHEKIRIVLELFTGVPWVSTDKDHIKRYEDEYGEHPFLEQLKRHHHAQRAVSTYLHNWIRSQDENGFIHGGFNASGAKTGRLSSSSGTLGAVGNFQNIPARGFVIKECLITPDGWALLQYDYSALELRLASFIAHCTRMIEQFAAGADLHAYTRDTINIGEILNPGLSLWQAFNKELAAGHLEVEPGSQVTEDEARSALNKYYRQVAKTLNFGLLYGGTWRMVNRLLKVGEVIAADLHYAWNSLYPEYAKANADWTKMALTQRLQPNKPVKSLYVQQPISGRTRKFGLYPVVEQIYDPEKQKYWTSYTRASEAKDAFNFAVQGLGGYINAMSGLRICRMHDNSYFRPFATIHDSLDFYLRRDRLDVLPSIEQTLCDWDVFPRLEVEGEYAYDGKWQHVRGITDLDLFISSGAEQGWKKK